MSTRTPASSRHQRSVGSARSSSRKDADAEEEDDDDTLDALRAPNESPERRTTSDTVHDAVAAKYVYDDYLDEGEFFRSCVKNHKKHSNRVGVLFAMAMGNLEYDDMLAPFSETNKRKFTKHFKPSNQMLMFEVTRRAYYIAELAPEDETNSF